MKYITKKYITEKVLDVVKEQFIDNLNISISESSNLAELNADSLDRINIAIDLEEEFSISIKDEDTEQWTTVQDIINYIERTVL